MKKLIIPLSIICLCFGKTPRYGDEQIAVMINEYFKLRKPIMSKSIILKRINRVDLKP